jgi:hypothetical protein
MAGVSESENEASINELTSKATEAEKTDPSTCALFISSRKKAQISQRCVSFACLRPARNIILLPAFVWCCR